MFGAIKSRLALRSAMNDLKSAEKRGAALREIGEYCGREYAAHRDKLENWRQPILQAAEALAEADADEGDAFRAALKAMPEEAFWRHELLKRILPKPQIAAEDLEWLEQEALASPRNLGTWKRLLEEVKRQGDRERFARIREALVIKLGEFFPAAGENTWYDIETESQTRSLFFNFLDDTIDAAIQANRTDAEARQLLEMATERFPQRLEVQYALARIYQLNNEESMAALETILQGLMYNPADNKLKIYAASLLMQHEGLHEKGLSILHQVWEEEADNQEAVKLLAAHYLQDGGLDGPAVAVVRKWLTFEPSDARAAAALAEYHAQRNDRSPEAINAYKAAVEAHPDDPKFLRSLAEAMYAQEHWTEAARLYDRLASLTGISAELAAPLSVVFAELNRLDSHAIEVYAAAFKAGNADPFVLSTFCKALYHQNPSDVEALEAFHKIYRDNPRCLWAALGVARKEMIEGNSEAALGKLVQLLMADREIEEAMEMAAQIVAGNPKRALMRKLMGLDPKTALRIFERAAARQPDALSILCNLAHYRLEQGMRDAKTEKLLATICLRDPDELEMRLARADLLHEMGKLDVAVDLYKELIVSSRKTSAENRGSEILDTAVRARMLSRVAEYLQRSPLSKRDDLTFLIEAALDPAAAPEAVVTIARKVNKARLEHALDLPLFEKALAIQTEDEELEFANARARARRGNARELIQLAIARVESMRYESEVAALLGEAVHFARTPNITQEIESRIIRLFETHRHLPDQIAIHLAQILIIQGGFKNEFRPVFRRVASLPKPPPEFLDALQKCRTP